MAARDTGPGVPLRQTGREPHPLDPVVLAFPHQHRIGRTAELGQARERLIDAVGGIARPALMPPGDGLFPG